MTTTRRQQVQRLRRSNAVKNLHGIINTSELNDDELNEFYNKIKGMASMLQKCNTIEEVALLYQPNLDSWEWNKQNIPARKQIWGI